MAGCWLRKLKSDQIGMAFSWSEAPKLNQILWLAVEKVITLKTVHRWEV